MKRNDLMTFAPVSRDRETLPVLPLSVQGRAIECSDQSGVMRLLPGDRVRIEELRGDHALVAHVALVGALLLTSISQLRPIPAEANTSTQEDAAL